MAKSRFCQSGMAMAASATAATSASGSQNCQRFQTTRDGRDSCGSRFSRDVTAVAGGSGTAADTVAPQAAAWRIAASTTALRQETRSTRISFFFGLRPTTTASK